MNLILFYRSSGEIFETVIYFDVMTGLSNRIIPSVMIYRVFSWVYFLD